MSSYLLCIPEDGSPFEACGIDNYPTAYDIYNMLGIVNIDGKGIKDYDDDMLECNTPFQINPLYSYNPHWRSISEVINKYYNTYPRLHTIRLYIRKNQHHFSNNKHTVGVGRRPTPPKGIICIWITTLEYLKVSPLPKKKWCHDTLEWIKCNDESIEEKSDLNIIRQGHMDRCNCYTCLGSNLSWTLANL